MTARIGNYELVATLATGGMAETHVARSINDGSVAVIKRLLPRYAGNAEFIEMFIDEGRVVSSLKHPNVVGMREFGFHDELPYLVLEYLHGVNLRTLTRTLIMRHKQQMPLDIALHIAMSICAGLHHAHDARTIDGKPMEVIHRDVSPQNVVLTFEGEVKLIDFGIATARGQTHETKAGALKGKIPYMAPEQVRAGAIDRRTDVYAAGVVIYEILTARRPYISNRQRMSEFTLMMAIVNHEVVPVDAIRSIPPELAGVVMKALEVDPKKRFQTAQAMQDALAGVAKQLGVTISAKRLSTMMIELIAPRHVRLEPSSSKEVAEIVSEAEEARTKVDERHDPSVVDKSELTPISVLTTKPVAAKHRPAPDDVIEESERISPVVDKIVDANLTRLRFHRAIRPGFRWGRLFDGIEGAVEIDFTAVAEISASSITAAREALLGLGDEVSEIRLIAVPIALAIEVEDRCRLVSVSCRGRCPKCDALVTAILEYETLRDRLASGRPLECPTCSTNLVDMELAAPPRPEGSDASGQSIRMLVSPVPAVVPEPPPPMMPAPEPAPLPVAPRGESPWGWTFALVTMLGFAGGAWMELRQTDASVTKSDPGIERSPGEWRIELEGYGASEAECVTTLRLRALEHAIDALESELPAAIKAWRVRPCEPGFDTSRFELEPVSSRWNPNEHRAVVVFRIAEATRSRLRAFHSQTRSAWGLELANSPPCRAPGVIVLGAPAGGNVVAGDRLISVGGTRVVDLASLPQTTEPVPLVVEHQERREILVNPPR